MTEHKITPFKYQASMGTVTTSLYPTMTVVMGPPRPVRTLHVILDELIAVLSR
jgi:hypothetical protein